MISSQSDWGGGEQLVWSLGKALIERGHELTWIAPAESVLMRRIQAQGWSHQTIVGRHPSPRELLRLRGALRESGVEVAFGNDSHAIVWGSMLSMGSRHMKRVGVKHTVFPIKSAAKYNWLLDRMICVSRAVHQVCLDGGIADHRLSIVHGGVDAPDYERSSARVWAAKLLGIPLTRPLFCAVGSLVPCKSYDILLRAVACLREHMPDFHLVLCGDGPQRAELEQLIEEHELSSQVTLLGFRDDSTRWIAAADVFVHPSTSEGLSLVSILAQMLGTPVLASEVGGLREVMRCRHTSRPLGWIYASQDARDLADLMRDAYSNRAKRMQLVDEARRSAKERFTLERMVLGVENVLNQAVGETDGSYDAPNDLFGLDFASESQGLAMPVNRLPTAARAATDLVRL